MTFDPFRDMRDAVPSEPPPAVEGQRAAPWMGAAFAVAMVVVIVAGSYFFGSTMSPSMRADNPAAAERPQTR